MDLLAHGLDHLVDAVGDAPEAVAVAAGHADHAPGGANRRSLEMAAIARVTGGEFQVILTAAVADRGDAAAQALLGVGERANRNGSGAHLLSGFAGIGLGAKAKVHVAIDDPR